MEVPRRHLPCLDELLDGVILYRAAELFSRRAGQDALVDHPVAAFDDIPTFGLRRRIAADGLDGIGIRVDLERKFVVCVQQLEQQRESPIRHGPAAAQQAQAQFASEVRQRRAGGWAVGDPADAFDEVGQLPTFTDGLACRQKPAKESLEVPPAPDLLFVDRHELVWVGFHGQAGGASRSTGILPVRCTAKTMQGQDGPATHGQDGHATGRATASRR